MSYEHVKQRAKERLNLDLSDFDKDYIAKKLKVSRNTINGYFWMIRRNLERAELITKRKNGEKKNYNYLISFAKEVIKEQTNENKTSI